MKKYMGAVAIIVYDKKLLLMLRDSFARRYPNRWALIGGKVEEGEDPSVTIRRELEEEIGVVPRQIVEVVEYMHIDPDANGRWSKFYFCLLTPEEFHRIKKGDEGQSIEFFSFDKLKDLNPIGFIFQNPERLKILGEMIATGNPINVEI